MPATRLFDQNVAEASLGVLATTASPTTEKLVQALGCFAGQSTIYVYEAQQLQAGYQRVGDYMVHPDRVRSFVAP